MAVKLYPLLLFFLLGGQLKAQKSVETPTDRAGVPSVAREFRAAWVATVANINWPSEPGLPVKKQKEEAIHILESLAFFNFNAVVFQVRPQGDALYDSTIEPWSYFLTGKQGEAPDPYYDPLKFWINAAHKRGIELHVWLNPYRIHHISAPKPSEKSMVYQMKEAAVHLKEGYWWLDPAKKETQKHTKKVVKDLLLRYDIDGVHFDDYFYPYESYNNGDDFPDNKSWKKYQKEGGLLSRKDWRRDAVNQLVRDVYYLIKSYKPYVKFGVSPFGIWRPKHPKSIEGMDQYDKLYADAKKWLNYGWVDYLSPQLYWRIRDEKQSFPVLLAWWQKQNTHNRFIWPGINDYNAAENARGADEIQNQIMINRGIENENPGVVHWSVQPLLNNDTLQERLKATVYRKKALIPVLAWDAKGAILPKPVLKKFQKHENIVEISWSKLASNKSNFTVLQAKYGSYWEVKIVGKRHVLIPQEKKGENLKKIELSFIDRYGRKGKGLNLEINEAKIKEES